MLDYLIKIKEANSKKDSTYLFKDELLGRDEINSGIFKFGLTASHAPVFFFIKEENEIKIIQKQKLEEILIEVSNFFLRSNIKFEDKLKYYNQIITIVKNQSVNHPWEK